jgi:chaperonin GroES
MEKFGRKRGGGLRRHRPEPALHGDRPAASRLRLAKQQGVIALKVRPLHDRILAVRLEEEERSAGGIIIPDTAKEKPLQARVVAVGPGKVGDDGKVQALDVSAGDKILIGKYSGTEINIEGEEHVILREDDVLAIID